MMKWNGMCLVLSSITVLCCLTKCEGNTLERDKRDDTEWTVTTLIEKPYVSKKKDHPTSNDDFEGFVPDILKKIGEKLSQKYRLKEVSDGKYGMQEGRNWNGMIGEVKNSHAQLAAAPITITDDRREVVDFTIPFMTFGTVILMRKPANASAVPKSAREVIEGGGIQRYLVMSDGSTEQQIRGSADSVIALLPPRLEQMSKQEDAVTKVRQGAGKYAYIGEEYTANYWKRQEPCELMTMDVDQLKKKEYALALKKGSANTEKINKILQEMKDNGEMEALKKRWWDGPCSAGSRVESVTLTLAAVLSAVAYFAKF